MHNKALRRVEIKDASQGRIQAVFSTFGVVDHDNDLTVKTAFKDGAPVQISAFNHGSWEGALPVGKGVIRVTDNEAVLDGQFFMQTQHGRDTFETVKEMGELQEFSYGFFVTDSEPGEHEGKAVRVIKAVDVTEVSPVLKGAGVGTRTLALKRQFSQEERERLADDGKAMPDGSFPIVNVEDLKNAIQAFGRADDPDAVRRHIVRRARALDREDLLPEEWRKVNDDEKEKTAEKRRAVRGPIPQHETEVLTRAWNATNAVKSLHNDARPSELRTVYAWVDPDGDPEAKSSYAYPHHHGVDGPANARACLIGIAQLNSDPGVPEEHRKAVYDHLASHLRDADREPPELRTAPEEEKKQMRFGDEASEVMASLSSLIDRATEVLALRRSKGRNSMSPYAADLLSWLSDDMTRLKSLLETPVEDDKPVEVDEDQLASLYFATVATLNDL